MIERPNTIKNIEESPKQRTVSSNISVGRGFIEQDWGVPYNQYPERIYDSNKIAARKREENRLRIERELNVPQVTMLRRGVTIGPRTGEKEHRTRARGR